MKYGLLLAVLTALTFAQLPATQAGERENKIRQITLALGHMSVYDVGDFLIKVIPDIDGGVRCDEFSNMLKKSSVYDRGAVVKKVASYIRRPFSDRCFATVSKLVSIYDAADAIIALQMSKPKY